MFDLLATAPDALAAAPDLLAAGGENFFNTTLGKALGSVMKAAAILIVLAAAMKSIKDFMNGKVPKGIGTIVATAVVVTFLWQPALITDVISLFSNLTGQGVSTVDELTR
jgi:chromate transport protein ChrA